MRSAALLVLVLALICSLVGCHSPGPAGGSLVETQALAKDRVPAAVVAGVVREYPGYFVQEAQRRVYSDGTSLYDVEIESVTGGSRTATFDDQGRLVR